MSAQEHLSVSINLAYVWYQYIVVHMLTAGEYGKDIWAELHLLQSEDHGMYFHHLCMVASYRGLTTWQKDSCQRTMALSMMQMASHLTS